MADNKQLMGPEEHITPEAAAPDMPGPDLTAKEAVALEKEGKAALREMGEALPDLGDNVVPFAAAGVEKPGPDKADKPEKSQEAAKPRRSRPSKVDKAAPDGATPPK